MKNYCETVDQSIDRFFQIIVAKYDQCAWIFLDISQAFDKAWDGGLIFKLKKTFEIKSVEFFHILSDFLYNRRVLRLILGKSVMDDC